MEKQAFIVTDLSYGDTGKGTTVDYLARQVQSAAVIRHNGGPQAAHNVVTPAGLHHTFAQFGSGSFVPGVRTHLSRFMLVNPLNMLREAQHLIALGVSDIWERTSVDEDALLILPWHRSANRLRELARGADRHGSTGQGVGEAQMDALLYPDAAVRVRDLRRLDQLVWRLQDSRRAKFERLRAELDPTKRAQADEEWAVFQDRQLIPWLADQYRLWSRLVTITDGGYLQWLADSSDALVFEGAQGVLLDEHYGFHPYTTWSTTTHANALTLLAGLDFVGDVTRYGTLRSYTTRHGAGPFVTEDESLTRQLPDVHNGTGRWQGGFRVGHFDLVAHRYALDVSGGADELVVTGLDRLNGLDDIMVCVGYRMQTMPDDAVHFFEFDSDGVITAIKAAYIVNRPRQARLTELIMSCSPVYRTVGAPPDMPASQEASYDVLLRTIEDHLGTPVSITSFGPTWADKRALVVC